MNKRLLAPIAVSSAGLLYGLYSQSAGRLHSLSAQKQKLESRLLNLEQVRLKTQDEWTLKYTSEETQKVQQSYSNVSRWYSEEKRRTLSVVGATQLGALVVYFAWARKGR